MKLVAIYLGAALMAAWAILRAWDHLTRRVPPPDPLDAIQPWDCRSITLADGRGTHTHPRLGVFDIYRSGSDWNN